MAETTNVIVTKVDADTQGYHTPFLMHPEGLVMFEKWDVDNEEKLGKLSEKAQGLVKAVLAIDGVTNVSISTYQLRVVKGVAFSWAEIHLPVCGAIKEAFEVEDLRTEFRSSNSVPSGS